MNKQINNFILGVTAILLLSACGGLEAAPASVDTPRPVATENPIGLPTAVPLDGSAFVEPDDYIGLIYPPSPEGLSKSFSMMIWDTDGYGLSLVLDGADKMLWLEKITGYDESGSAFWEVKDVLVLSGLEAGLILTPDGCSLNGVPDSEIIAAGKNGVIRLAWRADTALDKFESVPTDGIECHSDKGMSLE